MREEYFQIQTPTGDKINVMVLEIRNGRQVRLGIDAPLAYTVLRQEHLEPGTEPHFHRHDDL
jgi:sRNA-binding carbon storage regulator CsrA